MKKIIFKLKFYAKFMLRLLYSLINGGNECLICGKKSFSSLICKECEENHFSVKSRLSLNRCSVCGKELLLLENICFQCRQNRVLNHLDFVLPMYSYRLWNKELMFLWKSKAIRSLSWFFAKKISSCLDSIGVSVIVPVPPRPKKIQEEGWDQIDELCNFCRYFFGFEVLDILERKSSVQQKKLDRNERLESIGKSYFLKDEAHVKRVLKRFGGNLPQEVCLVDDVCTTGSTLESCAVLLKSLGIKKVYAVTLFTVD